MTNLTTEPPTTSGGTRYELLKGDSFYGVVDTAADERPIVATYPLTSTGWFDARRRCSELELEGTTPRTAARTTDLPASTLFVPAILIGVGVVLGLVGLFPDYSSLASLASQSDQLVPHILYLVGWGVVAGLVAWRRPMTRVAAAFGVGLSAMSIGFFLTDVTTIASSHVETAGAGIYLSLVGWAFCAVGSISAALASWRADDAGFIAPMHRTYALPAGLIVIFSAVMFALPWDRYSVIVGATGQVQTVSAGNAFSNPGAVIVAELIVMGAMVVLLFGPTLWRSVRLATALFAGAVLPLVGQIVAAVIQPAPALSAFGVTPQMAAQEQVHLDAGFTAWFYLFATSVALLIVVGAWMASHARAGE